MSMEFTRKENFLTSKKNTITWRGKTSCWRGYTIMVKERVWLIE